MEHDAVVGHNNKKQKIHYITVLKQQINELIEENRKLRNTTNFSSPSSAASSHGRESILSMNSTGERS
jgi:hypothetical protein